MTARWMFRSRRLPTLAPGLRWVTIAAGVVAALLALVPGWVAPALAATVAGSIDQPSSDGAVITVPPASAKGNFAVATSDGTAGVIHDVRVTVTSADGHPGDAFDYLNTTGPDGGEGPTQGFVWSHTLDYDGQYTLTAVATYHDSPPDSFGNQTFSVSRVFYVRFPPAIPSGLTAQFDSGSRAVKLNWSPNSEADLVGYDVYRRDPGSTTFGAIAHLALTTSYSDATTATAAPGTYTYEVVARRSGGTGQPDVVSDPSKPASAGVSGPPAPTTAPPGSSPTGSGPAPGGPGPSGSGGGPQATIPPGGRLAAAPPLPAPTRAGAGDFASLLAQARAATVTTVPTEPDPGFNPKLPFTPQTSRELVNIPGASQLAGGTALGEDSARRRRVTFEYLAGALVLFMLSMHALFLKRQVDLALLEAVDPGEGSPAGAMPNDGDPLARPRTSRRAASVASTRGRSGVSASRRVAESG